MTFNTTSKMVSPDKRYAHFFCSGNILHITSQNISPSIHSAYSRKGMLSVLQADDQLMHLQWKDRGTGTIEVCWRFSAIMILILSLPTSRTTSSSSLTTSSSKPCPPVPPAGCLSSSSRRAIRECSSGCRSACNFVCLCACLTCLRNSTPWCFAYPIITCDYSGAQGRQG